IEQQETITDVKEKLELTEKENKKLLKEQKKQERKLRKNQSIKNENNAEKSDKNTSLEEKINENINKQLYVYKTEKAENNSKNFEKKIADNEIIPPTNVTNQEILELKKRTTKEDDDILCNSLLIIAKRGNLDLFIDTIKYNNLNINWQDELGMTALLEATKANQWKMIKFLIKNGANPKIVTKNNISNLRFAVENNNKKTVKFFLKKGLEVGKRDIIGQSPLLVAIEKNYYEITKILLDNIKNFDVDLQDKNGKTLLMAATENNDIKLVKTLLSKDANIWLLNNRNEDALTIAERHANKNLINLLKKRIEKDRKNNPNIKQWIRKN
ncbi:MAG: ankyrin repeat domain-containing protein, partial [Elusimicrobiota bacterium]|nr:ankyrin repeat domain-containing protein [Elusimicrobiota bacterium]